MRQITEPTKIVLDSAARGIMASVAVAFVWALLFTIGVMTGWFAPWWLWIGLAVIIFIAVANMPDEPAKKQEGADEPPTEQAGDGPQGRPPGSDYVACGHDPRRCCENCCPDEESSNGQGGGCHTCGGGLALPRVGEGMTGEQVATLIDAMLEEVHDDPAVTDALRFVLHVTRGDSCPAAYEKFLNP